MEADATQSCARPCYRLEQGLRLQPDGVRHASEMPLELAQEVHHRLPLRQAARTPAIGGEA
eukprot:5347317-Lingulodinium_polyedra.AAC.1